MEVTGRKSISQTNIMFCKPCEDDNKHVPANGLCRECEEHMCIACFGNHKKYKICKDHSMVDIDTNIPDLNDTKEDNFENCLEHKNENIKFYCSSHEKVGCGDCIILEHKTCNVDYVRDISKAFKDSKVYNDIVKHVDSCQKAVQKCSTSISNNKLQIEDVHQGFLADIKSFRDEISSRLDTLEERLVEKANDAKTTDKLRIESLEAPCVDLEQELSQISDDIVSKTDEPNKLFVTAMQCKHVLNEIEQKLCSIMSNNRISSYSFKRNNKIEEILDQVELGSVYTIHGENAVPDSQSYEEPISVQAKPETSRTLYEENASRPASQCYDKPTSVQVKPGSSQTICRQNTSRPDSQNYEELIYEEIPESNISRKRGSSRHKNWSLFENQLRCENLLMAGEYLSFKDNGKGDIGLFIGKRAIKAGTYFEVELISSDDKGNIAIGFVPKDFSLKEQPGVGRFSVGYHAKDGCKHDQSTSGERISPPCKVGDVIGIGVASYLTNVFKTKIDIFFTRNHQKIGALEINNPSFCKVYPAVGLQSSGDKARVVLDAQVP
ncbi:uncharacterized protein LOC123542447 isoform X2 [Mercenaria mercenaria]|uniref:uncharacterized protein LOC123542447 isoform X2 n=1 Tax=Mercenaria mercenaria TaxID=6596 RepID=UPI00234EDB73|nr:uncharacterized protein LOC123542447 isoform X2 [Mercenaria mercenaria]